MLLAAGWSQNLTAFTYTNTNLLLVFPHNANDNDVEFNLGSVSNFLGKANGTVIPVNNWDLNLVKAQNNNSLANVKFLLLAVTEVSDSTKRVWMSDASSGDTPTDITGSKWSQLYSRISSVGAVAAAATASNTTSQTWVTNKNDTSSYTYVASSGGEQEVTTISGISPFPIEGGIPATNKFVELKTSSITPKPASTIVGVFTMTSAGVLTFTAGPPPTTIPPSQIILPMTRVGNLNSITFTTVSGANYRLRYTTNFVPHLDTWTILPTSVAGDGSNKTLTDSTADARRFYAVEAF